MFKAYIDDSRSSVGDRNFYLAAYVLRADAWEHFIKEWRAALLSIPSISYLHTVDANALKGEFEGWSRKRRNRKLITLAKVIERYQPVPFIVSVNQNDFEEIYQPAAGYHVRDPYFVCFYAMIDMIARASKESGAEYPVSFVFDQHGEIGIGTVKWFEYIKSLRPELADYLKTTPIFEDDELVEPLQAADMLAWHFRRGEEGRTESLPADKHLYPNGQFFKRDLDRDVLLNLAEAFSALPGIGDIKDKKRWKELKSEVHSMLAAGIVPPDPIAARGNFIQRARKLASRFIGTLFFRSGDKS